VARAEAAEAAAKVRAAVPAAPTRKDRRLTFTGTSSPGRPAYGIPTINSWLNRPLLPSDLVTSSTPGRFGPAPIVLIHILAFIGVAFWLSMIVTALTGGIDNAGAVIILGLVLGGAHVAISRFTSAHSTRAVWAMWFVLICDAGLALLVNPQAVLLMLFTIVLLVLTRLPSARGWFAAPA